MGLVRASRRSAEQPQQQAFFGALNAMSGGRVVPAGGVDQDAGGVVGAVGIGMSPTRTRRALADRGGRAHRDTGSAEISS
jgi:hypothetical protein